MAKEFRPNIDEQTGELFTQTPPTPGELWDHLTSVQDVTQDARGLVGQEAIADMLSAINAEQQHRANSADPMDAAEKQERILVEARRLIAEHNRAVIVESDRIRARADRAIEQTLRRLIVAVDVP